MNTVELPLFHQADVIVFGDVMLDSYWYGGAQRISPEAPVPVVKIQRTELRPGGAANVALNVRSLGAHVELFGLVGCDAEAGELRYLLESKGVICHFLSIEKFPTITKLRVIGRNQQLIRMDFEEGFHSVDLSELWGQYQKSVAHTDVVILSDYAKGSLTQATRLIDIARGYGKPVLVDPKESDVMHYCGATVLTPNRKEFEAIVGICETQEEMVNRARVLIEKAGLSAILITLGKDGMLLLEANKEPYTIPTQAQQVYDVTGAGDTVIAVLAASLATRLSLQKCTYIANAAAGIVVAKVGAETVSVAELKQAFQVHRASQLGVVRANELLYLVQEAKASGERVVMTNGCFDLLHAGHVHYLEQAKKLGDRLIVAVNSDDSVRRLKGEYRPVNTLAERMNVLAGLRAVDWVVSFSEDTPERLINEILPNVLVKGGDYTVEQIAGHQAVLAHGGDVIILDFVEGISTTAIIQKMGVLQ